MARFKRRKNNLPNLTENLQQWKIRRHSDGESLKFTPASGKTVEVSDGRVGEVATTIPTANPYYRYSRVLSGCAYDYLTARCFYT